MVDPIKFFELELIPTKLVANLVGILPIQSVLMTGVVSRYVTPVNETNNLWLVSSFS